MNSFGRIFKVSIFGESHGAALGVVVDGVKAGVKLDAAAMEADILRRKSGAKGTTPRIEGDEPEILSGVFEGCTTGAPVAILFRNMNTRSGDYDALKDVPRPGHADYTASVKWNGFNDPRGGGHFSGRLTLPLVAAGAIAKLQTGFRYSAELVEIGGETCKEKWDGLLSSAAAEGDSLGGVNGGLTNGAPIVFRVAFKPTSSIAKGQDTLNVKSGEMVCLNVPGRHDVCFALRTPVVVEALSAIVLADLQLVGEGLKC